MQQVFVGCKGTRQRRECETEKNKYSRKTKQLRFTNKFIDTFLKAALTKIRAMLFSTLLCEKELELY